jgi:hypothetical protein
VQGASSPPIRPSLRSSTGDLGTLSRLLRVDLLAVLVEPDSRGRGAVAAADAGADAHDLAVDGARDAVLQLQVHLGDGVVGEDGCVADITCDGHVRENDGGDAVVVVGNVRMAADSTMLRMVNLLIALSLGVHREQLEHRMGLTWPRPFLLRPLWELLACLFLVVWVVDRLRLG